MVKLKGVAVSSKGAVVPQARKVIKENAIGKVVAYLDSKGFDYYQDNGAFALPYIDENGNVLYATLTLSVGLKRPNEKAKKSGGAKPKADQPKVEIGD